MKQQITREQWQELTLRQQRRFQETINHGGFPTIGDMIEFLYKHMEKRNDNGERYVDTVPYPNIFNAPADGLCDELWQAVKKILQPTPDTATGFPPS